LADDEKGFAQSSILPDGKKLLSQQYLENRNKISVYHKVILAEVPNFIKTGSL
jgi:hypothetical protein